MKKSNQVKDENDEAAEILRIQLAENLAFLVVQAHRHDQHGGDHEADTEASSSLSK